jgi:hypothetical protein
MFLWLVPDIYGVLGDGAGDGVKVDRVRVNFIASPQIRLLGSSGTIVHDWRDIAKGETINAPAGATQAEVRLPEWFTYSGSNRGSNVLVLNTSTLIGGGNQSLYTLTQSGSYELSTRDGYGPNPTDTTRFELILPAAVAVTGVTLNKTAATLAAGARETLVATVAPANATNPAVTWSSHQSSPEPAVAVVHPATGEVTALAPGAATITATTHDGGFTATCVVTVTAATQNAIPLPLVNGEGYV